MKARLYLFAYRLPLSLMSTLALNILILFVIQYFLTSNVHADSPESPISPQLEEEPPVTYKQFLLRVAILVATAGIIIIGVMYLWYKYDTSRAAQELLT